MSIAATRDLSSVDLFFKSEDKWFQLEKCPIPLHKIQNPVQEETNLVSKALYTTRVEDPSKNIYRLTVQYHKATGFYSSLSAKHYHYFSKDFTPKWNITVLNESRAKKIFDKCHASLGIKDKNEEKKVVLWRNAKR